MRVCVKHEYIYTYIHIIPEPCVANGVLTSLLKYVHSLIFPFPHILVARAFVEPPACI